MIQKRGNQMNHIVELLNRLKEQNINIKVQNDQLKINAAPDALNEKLLDEIRNNKDGIIRFLNMNSQSNEFIKIKPVEKKEYYEVSSAQKRMYALQQIDTNNTNYNMPRIVELTDRTDKGMLEQIFRKLIDQHESFRTSFEIHDNELKQKIY